MSVNIWIIISVGLAWFAGGILNGIAGFGSALIAMPFIILFIDVELAVTSCVLIVLIVSFHNFVLYRKELEWKRLVPVLVGSLPGCVLGVYLLAYIPEEPLKICLGFLVFCYGLWGLFAGKQTQKTIASHWGYCVGFLATTFGATFGFNGPPLAIYASLSGWQKHSIKAALAFSIGFTCFFVALTQFVMGFYTQGTWILAAIAAPFVIFGSRLGAKLSCNLNETKFRKILYIVLCCIGGSFLIKGVIALFRIT